MPATRTSPHPVADTVERIVAELERRSLTLFARIDHAAGARAAGLALGDEVVLVLGDPQAGTPLMQAEPLVGLDLPLRILVCERGGETVIAFHDPVGLQAEYALADRARLEGMRSLLAALADAAAA